MTINAKGWLDWAVREDGPWDKTYNATHGRSNEGLGIVWHSMEGWRASIAKILWSSRPASWMFTICLDGTLLQHYPVHASCWASGNMVANTSFWSVELEGTKDMPINEAQIATAMRLMGEWENETGKKATRNGGLWERTMYEHREVATIAEPNAGPTACPSGRYDKLWERLKGEGMDPQDKETLDALVAIFGGREKILEAKRMGNDYLLGYAIEQEQQRELARRLDRLERLLDAVTEALERWTARQTSK